MKVVWISLLFFPVTGFAASAWALLDALRRPAVQFRVAGISRSNTVWGFGNVCFWIGLVAFVFGFGGTSHFLGLFLFGSVELVGIVGLLAAAWYLLPTRRWLRAQLRFARQGLPEA